MKKEFGINVISTACGVMPHTIRTWEKRYQVFTPERSKGGQRLYTKVDLTKSKPNFLMGGIIGVILFLNFKKTKIYYEVIWIRQQNMY